MNAVDSWQIELASKSIINTKYWLKNRSVPRHCFIIFDNLDSAGILQVYPLNN